MAGQPCGVHVFVKADVPIVNRGRAAGDSGYGRLLRHSWESRRLAPAPVCGISRAPGKNRAADTPLTVVWRPPARVKPYNRIMSPPNRKSVRLPDYDYRLPGAYFITICTYKRQPFLSKIYNTISVLSDEGQIVKEEWFRTAAVRTAIVLRPDEFIVMPNHAHGIMHRIDDPDRVEESGIVKPRGLVSGSLGAVIGQIKSITTKRINRLWKTSGRPVWQRNYYEHIIRSEQGLERIRNYILANPANWADDRLYYKLVPGTP